MHWGWWRVTVESLVPARRSKLSNVERDQYIVKLLTLANLSENRIYKHLHYGMLSKRILTQVQNSRDSIKTEVIKSGNCSTRWTNLSSHFASYSRDKSVLIINHMFIFTLECTQSGIPSVHESFVDAGVAAGEHLNAPIFAKESII